SGSGKVKRMNTAAKNIFGLKESFQKDAAFVELIRIPQLIDFVKSALEKKEPSETNIEIFEPKYQALKVTAAPYMNAGNDRLGVVLVLSNITEIKTLERHRSEFVANVSHELRTPLTSIQGYAETLLHPKLVESPEKVHEFAEKIRDNSIRLKNMVDDMLFLANVEQNKERREKRFTEHNLSFLLNKAVEFLKVKALSEQMELNLDVEEDFKIKVNEGLMVQVFVNLIDNAIKYSAGAKQVDIKLFKDNADYKLEVRDFGEGISEEHIPRLFERFYRVDKDRSRKKGGSGLGLSIVKNILSLHQLEISVDSILGEGTVFTILFPGNQLENMDLKGL
ncbi:MAG: ATP-binding protein, partial [Bdellovibrionota bacterium]|nr:ATP-binding protein [Bdellovibrionota bacterium]